MKNNKNENLRELYELSMKVSRKREALEVAEHLEILMYQDHDFIVEDYGDSQKVIVGIVEALSLEVERMEKRMMHLNNLI